MKELVVDSFAGGGGASTGIRMALGHDADIAINHDSSALAMHRINHPPTRHVVPGGWVNHVSLCAHIVVFNPLDLSFLCLGFTCVIRDFVVLKCCSGCANCNQYSRSIAENNPPKSKFCIWGYSFYIHYIGNRYYGNNDYNCKCCSHYIEIYGGFIFSIHDIILYFFGVFDLSSKYPPVDPSFAHTPLTRAANRARFRSIVAPQKRANPENTHRRFAAPRKVRYPHPVQGLHAHVQGASLKAWGHDLCRVSEPWARCRFRNGPRSQHEHRIAVMARMTGRAYARAFARLPQISPSLVPHSGTGKSRRRLDIATAAEVLDLFEELAACFAPVAETPEGTAFVCVLPSEVMDRLATLGVELSEREEDAGEMPEQDPAEDGLADDDALHLWRQENPLYPLNLAAPRPSPRDALARTALLDRLNQISNAHCIILSAKMEA
ncbi:hypothetical protein ACT6QG_02320 [Xanthobacter sp. TB0136]|uniref:hypothetical protein n=1 Tax=Xanthobacter sp. TB0136 TaxID=3459177 RepID=UPI00403A5F55